jgi:hypothetical protein
MCHGSQRTLAKRGISLLLVLRPVVSFLSDGVADFYYLSFNLPGYSLSLVLSVSPCKFSLEVHGC